MSLWTCRFKSGPRYHKHSDKIKFCSKRNFYFYLKNGRDKAYPSAFKST